MSANLWRDVATALPLPRTGSVVDYGSWCESAWVLAWDGREVYKACVQHWENDPPAWHLDGSSAVFDPPLKGITHWMPLPNGPEVTL